MPWGGGAAKSTWSGGVGSGKSYQAHNWDTSNGESSSILIAPGSWLNFNQDAGGTIIDWDDFNDLDLNLSSGWGFVNGLPNGSKVQIMLTVRVDAIDNAAVNRLPYCYMGANVGNWWASVQANANNDYDMNFVSPILYVSPGGINNYPYDLDLTCALGSFQIFNPAASTVSFHVTLAKMLFIQMG